VREQDTPVVPFCVEVHQVIAQLQLIIIIIIIIYIVHSQMKYVKKRAADWLNKTSVPGDTAE
jgi:hypothetical protein